MGRLRGNPWFGVWNESENDGYHNLYPHPTPVLDKAREESFDRKYKHSDGWKIIQPAKKKEDKK